MARVAPRPGGAGRSSAIDLDGSRRSAGAARDFVEDRLVRWGCSSSAPTAQLVVSELVTNVWRHVGSSCRVVVTDIGPAIRLAVADASRVPPEPRQPDPATEGGRGLLIVGELVAAWGIDPQAAGKVTWADIRP
jgi:anti-sigma regulatory factor (Ser/Thr protein kinase)